MTVHICCETVYVYRRANLEFQPRQEKKLTGGNSFVPVTVAPTTNFNPSPMHNMYPMQMPVGPMQPQVSLVFFSVAFVVVNSLF